MVVTSVALEQKLSLPEMLRDHDEQRKLTPRMRMSGHRGGTIEREGFEQRAMSGFAQVRHSSGGEDSIDIALRHCLSFFFFFGHGISLDTLLVS